MSIVDIVLILIFAVIVIVAAKRGFVKSISGIVAWVLAGALALSFCGMVSDKIYETLFRDKVTQKIDERITVSEDAEEVVSIVSQVLSEIPEVVVTAAESVGIDIEALGKKTESFTSSEKSIAETLEENTVGPVIRAAIRAVVFVLMLIILSSLLAFLLKPIEKLVGKLPIVKQTNTVLGGVLGVIKAFVLIIVLSLILELLCGFVNEDFAKAVEESKIVNSIIQSDISNALFIK